MIVKILEFDKIYVHIHISMSVTRSNYTVGAMYQRQIKQYLTFCLGKKKAPLCWDLQTSNWCFNLKGMWKKISLRLSLLCSLIYCLSWKKVLHKMEIRLSPAGSSNYIFELSKNWYNGKLTWIIFRCKIKRVHFQQ